MGTSRDRKISGIQTLVKISMLYEGSILIKYNSTNEISLTIFNNKLEDWFKTDLLTSHEGAYETVYHKF